MASGFPQIFFLGPVGRVAVHHKTREATLNCRNDIRWRRKIESPGSIKRAVFSSFTSAAAAASCFRLSSPVRPLFDGTISSPPCLPLSCPVPPALHFALSLLSLETVVSPIFPSESPHGPSSSDSGHGPRRYLGTISRSVCCIFGSEHVESPGNRILPLRFSVSVAFEPSFASFFFCF